MSESSNDGAEDPGIEVRSYFARGRNALVARADFSELYASLYLHQMDCGIRHEPGCDALIRDALAALTLHCASRPRKESTAWTVHFQSPLANVFVSGSNSLGTVVGNVFTENVRETAGNLFYADVIAENQPSRRSVVEFEGSEFLRAAETLFVQSDQRQARLFRLDEEDVVLVAAQPDCDDEWLAGLDEQSVLTLDSDVELSLLESRHYRFECGCNQSRMLDMLLPAVRDDADGLFQGEEVLRIHCPRCGARHTVTRESLEARIKGS